MKYRWCRMTVDDNGLHVCCLPDGHYPETLHRCGYHVVLECEPFNTPTDRLVAEMLALT